MQYATLDYMNIPKNVEEFVAQAESATTLPHYREDFIAFSIGSGELDAGGGSIKNHQIIITNTQDSGAMGTYRQIFLRHGSELVEQGFAVLNVQQLQDLRNAFTPFNDDGKSHPNIDALDTLISGSQGAVIAIRYTS